MGLLFQNLGHRSYGFQNKSGYEIPFSSVPTQPLSTPNHKSMLDNLAFAEAEIDRQVSMGILGGLLLTADC